MDIYEALRAITWKKALFFKWKNDMEYRKHEPKKTEEEVMKTLKVKSFNEYIKWQTTPEYLELIQLMLASRFAEDLQNAYTSVAEKSREGDPASIKLMLELQKNITAANKANSKATKKPDNEAYADLEL